MDERVRGWLSDRVAEFGRGKRDVTGVVVISVTSGGEFRVECCVPEWMDASVVLDKASELLHEEPPDYEVETRVQ